LQICYNIFIYWTQKKMFYLYWYKKPGL
jgi:hypothetical protein